MAFRRALVVMAVIALSVTPVAAQTVDEQSLQNSVSTWATEIGAPGMAAQVVDGNGVLAEASVGVDGATPFVWGSVSKQFAAATAVGLERAGALDSTASVLDTVPQAGGMLTDPAVTVDDLVHHTSGLPHDITVTDDWSRRGSATDAVATIDPLDGTAPRGEFRYSSLNYLLLQAVIEQATGMPYLDAVRREVLNPAGADVVTDPDVVPPGHVPFFGAARAVDVGIDSAGLGYGYLAGSIGDLGRYASWRLGELRNGETGDDEVPTGREAAYGNGLYHENIGGEEVWWHSGAVPGYYTYVAFVPATNTAIVLATNRYGELEAERIAAVGRNATTSVIDGSTTELPGSSAFTVLGALGLMVALLVAGIVIRLIRRRIIPHTLHCAVVRGVFAVALGAAAVLTVVFVVSEFAGAPLSVMDRWAPDVTLLVWILIGTIVVAAALGVITQVIGYRRGQSSRISP